MLRKLFKHGVQFCLAVLTELWAPLHVWLAPTPLGSWLHTISLQELGQAWVSMAFTGGENLDVCPTVRQGSTQPLVCRMTFGVQTLHGWSKSNGTAIGPEHMAPGKRPDLPNDSLLCYNPFFPSTLLHRTLAPLFSEGTIFFREELCQFLNIILQLKGYLSSFPCFHFALSQF